jgi:hypothetical protein
MANPLRTRQVLWILLGVALLAGAGLMQGPLHQRAVDDELFIEANLGTEKSIVEVIPGGLRAMAFTYVWQRSQEQHQAGRHYDAREMAELACRLMPNFPGVWSFHAWNMAWNISVTTHTPEERWRWVRQGMELLRDEAIPRNRRALLLYKELGWIFFFKIGQSLDEMHVQYKQYWAAEMQRLLGATGYGSTADVLAAFEPIAQAPLDKSLDRQGRMIPGTTRPELIQADQLAIVLEDPAVAAYAARLAEAGITIDWALLEAYNRYSHDLPVSMVRVMPPEAVAGYDGAIDALINDPDAAEARATLLAFVRAQILWNVYRMDPAWMYGLMEHYQAPLDWRLPETHGLYWITFGLHIAEDVGLDGITAVNTERVGLFCLKTLTQTGRLIYQNNPANPQLPYLERMFDWRYIAPAQAAYLEAIEEEIGPDADPNDSVLASGHINYLKGVIQSLFAGYKRGEARMYYDFVRDYYGPTGPEWLLDLEDFVVFTLRQEDAISPELGIMQLQSALQAALEMLGEGDEEGFDASYGYARYSMYDNLQRVLPPDDRLPPWREIVASMATLVIRRPQDCGIDMSLADRATLYRELDVLEPDIQKLIYDGIANSPLPYECAQEGVDFDVAFPEPEGMAAFREAWREMMESRRRGP